MKKLLAIAPYSYLPYFSGGQKFIAHFFEWLGKETDLTVISVNDNDFSQAHSYKGLAWLRNSKSRYIDRRLINKIAALVDENSFDALIIEHPYYAWLAFAIRKKTGIPVIIHTHNIEYQRFRSTGRWWWPVLKNYEKKAFRNADAILFISSTDRHFAINHWSIDPANCISLPFGTETGAFPEDRPQARKKINSLRGINENEKILLFTGLLNYKPNADAVKIIVEKLVPLLNANPSFQYKILVCGKGLDSELIASSPNILYAGFVENIDEYYKAADILLNPVQSGGGVKTKLLEAIAAGATVVSTETGAVGVEKQVCADKLVVVPDNDWAMFAAKTINQASLTYETPAQFYDYYHWPVIVKRVVEELSHKLSREKQND